MSRNEKKAAISVRPPQIAKTGIRAVELTTVAEDDCYEEFVIRDADLSLQEALDLRFLRGTIEHSKLNQTVFKQIKCSDVIVNHSDLSNAQWEKSLFSRVIVKASKLTGLRAIQGKWTDVMVRESKGDLSMFTLSKFVNVVFEDCVLTETIFQECEMEHVAFRKCDLTGCDFSGAKLKNVDFRESKIEKISIGPEQFSGLIIEPSQAAYLISVTGAKVLWAGE